MSGGSKKTVVGYWYKILLHLGLCKGPIDALLEVRGGGRTAWKGAQTASGQIAIDREDLWGGKKKEGGMSGALDVMFGEPTQTTNDYLTAQQGADQPTYRGKVTTVWRGGRFGTNPYPKDLAFKVRRILQGWDGGSAWYPEKAAIGLGNIADVGVAPGMMCVLSWDQSSFHDPSNNDPGSMWLEFYDAAGTLIDSIHGPTTWPPHLVWTRYSVSMAVPAGTATIAMVIEAFGLEGDNVDAYFRAIDLTIDGRTMPVINPSADEGTTGWVDRTGHILARTGLTAGEHMFWGQVYISHSIAAQSFPQSGLGMNPAHILYDTLTAADMKGEPTGLINDASFRAAADILAAEGLGLCMRSDEYSSIEAMQQQILDIIGGSLTQSRVDGLYYLDLLRPPADIGALPVITSDDMVEFRQQPAPGTQELVNQILVNWRDPERNEDRTTPPLQSLGGIQAAGGVISETRSYPEIPTEGLALRIGARDLQARSTPLSRFDLVTNRRPWAIRKGTHFRLQLPEEGIADMVCVLLDIRDSGLADGKLQIKAIQDVFTMPTATYVVAETGKAAPAPTTPANPPAQFILEMPYPEMVRNLSPTELAAFPDTSSAFLAAAARPTVGLNYTLYTAGTGETLDDRGTGEWCPRAQVTAAATRTTTALTLSAGEALDSVDVGSWALWDAEIVRVDAIDATAGTATVARGCVDTVPATHAAASAIWFLSDAYATDGREYAATEAVTAKLPVNSGSVSQDLASATLLSLTLASRTSRPYPPAKVKIAGADWPATVSGSFTVTWASRNRVTQADQIIDTTVASVTPADNIRYGLRFRRTDTNAVLVERSDITDTSITITLTHTGNVSMELWTLDDVGASWQSHLFTFAYTPPGGSPSDTIGGATYTPPVTTTIIDGGNLASLGTERYRMELRRASEALLNSTNEVPLEGEFIRALDTGVAKVGDGTAHWLDLPYFEHGFQLGRLGDVNTTGRANGQVLGWDSSLNQHVYMTPASGGGGGSGAIVNPMPPAVLRWVAVRHLFGAATNDFCYYASEPVAGVGTGYADAGANEILFSELINGVRGMRFNTNQRLTLTPVIFQYNITILAVVKTPTSAEWGSFGSSNIICGDTGSLQLRLTKSGSNSYVEVLRKGQASLGNDSAYGLIPAGTLIVVGFSMAANGAGTIYRNGIASGSTTSASTSANTAYIGSYSTSEPTLGVIAEVVAFDRVLASTAMGQAYNYLAGIWGVVSSGPAPPVTVALLPLDGTNGQATITDTTGRVWTRNGTGVAISTAQSVAGGSSLLFSDSGANSSFSTPAGVVTQTDLLTMEGWVYLLGAGFVTSNAHCLVGQSNNTTYGEQCITIDSTDRIGLILKAGNSSGPQTYSATAMTRNAWHHIAVTFDPGLSSNHWKVYLDGVNVLNITWATGWVNTTEPMRLGQSLVPAYSSYRFALNGYMDMWRITKGLVRYTSNFTPPTPPLGL